MAHPPPSVRSLLGPAPAPAVGETRPNDHLFPLEDEAIASGPAVEPEEQKPSWYQGLAAPLNFWDEDQLKRSWANPVRAADKIGLTALGAVGFLDDGADRDPNLISSSDAFGILMGTPRPSDIADSLTQSLKAQVARTTPDPHTTGIAARTLSGLADMGVEALVGSKAAGADGAMALLMGVTGNESYRGLREQGVDDDTATNIAGVDAFMAGAGFHVPMSLPAKYLAQMTATKAVMTQLGTAAAANVTLGGMSRWFTSAALEKAGFHDLAEQSKVFDGESIFADATVGGLIFGGHSAIASAEPLSILRAINEARAAGALDPSLVDAARVVQNSREFAIDRAPGVATTTRAANTHAAAMESAIESISRNEPVNLGSLADGSEFANVPRARQPDLDSAEIIRQEFAESGLIDESMKLDEMTEMLERRMRGEPEPPAQPEESAITPSPKAPETAGTAIPRTDLPLTRPQHDIEDRFAESLASDYEGAKESYTALPDTKGGKILSVDTARELSPDYLEDRTQSQAVHEPASWLIKKLYAEKLAQAPGPGEEPMVLFTGGGTGAGKSTALAKALGPIAERAQIIYDTNMNGVGSSIKKIDQALEAGKKVHLVYTYRDPIDALINGALKRARRQEHEFGSGRTVPIEAHVETHVGSNEAIRKIAEHYKGDKRVSLDVIDNSHGTDGAVGISLENLPRLDYNSLREEAIKTVKAEFRAGRISQAVRDGFLGAEEHAADRGPAKPAGASGAAKPDRSGASGEPQPERPERGYDRVETVRTPTGRKVEVQGRIAELADLITSDHPDFPKEIQPRDRAGRASSASQIAHIAQHLEPALLGESPEADRGAPIVRSNGKRSTEIPDDLEERGRPLESTMDAERALSAGERVFVMHEQDEEPIEVHSVEDLKGYSADTMLALPRGEQRVVESGNGRVLALKAIYEGRYANSAEKAAAYREHLESLGHDLTGFKEPVLVRERLSDMTPEERRAFSVEANQSSTAELSPVERAQADAKNIDAGMMAKLAGGDLTTAANASFVRDFAATLPESERGAIVDSHNILSQAGVRRLQAAILAKAYGGSERSNVTLGRILEGTDETMKSALGALQDAAPAFARLRQMVDDGVLGKEYDIAPAIIAAVEDAVKIKGSGKSLEEHLATQDMFSPKATAIKALFDEKGKRLAGREQVATALQRYADGAMAQRLNQASLFADEPASPADLMKKAAEPKQTTDMFGARRGPTTPRESVAAKPEPMEGLQRGTEAVLAAKPNLEILDDAGDSVRARTADTAATEAAEAMNSKATAAIDAATDCFARLSL